MKAALWVTSGCVVLAAGGAILLEQCCTGLSTADRILTLQAQAVGDVRPIAQLKEDNALILAAEEGDVAGVQKALANGAFINARFLDASAISCGSKTGYTALMLASMAGHTQIVKLLIDAKADLEVERRGRSSLYLAIVAGKQEVIETLLAAGAKGNAKQMRLSHELIQAACRGFKIRPGEGYPLYPGVAGDPDHGPTVADVLKQGADVNACDPEGYTALMYAANLGLINNVKVLLAAGADPTRKAKDGSTALSLAEREDSSVARAERREVVHLLNAVLKAPSRLAAEKRRPRGNGSLTLHGKKRARVESRCDAVG